MTCRILLPGQIPPSAIDMARDVNRKMKAAAMRDEYTESRLDLLTSVVSDLKSERCMRPLGLSNYYLRARAEAEMLNQALDAVLAHAFPNADLPSLSLPVTAEDWTTMEDNSVVVPFKRETI